MADAAQHLFNNLTVLHELKPGSTEFSKCIKENMFAKPNRTAFDQVLFYLCNMYDPVNYTPKVPWPILDRSQERTFRQNTVSFVKDIIKDVPEARIPPFSPSFLSTPGGERLTKFMWKFSLLVLKTVVEKESDYAVLSYPTAGLDILQNITDTKMEEFRKETDALCQLVIDASTHAKKLSNDIVNQSMELKTMRSELAETLQSAENCALSQEEKSIILDGDKEQSDAVFAKWQGMLNKEADQALIKFNSLKEQSVTITNCYESVKALVDSKTMPLVLDASRLPADVKDADGNLELAFVLSEGANAATALLNTISMCGGFQPLNSILPQLNNLQDELRKVEVSLTETKAGFMELLSEFLENMNSSNINNDQPETPLKGSLQMGYEMLQEAQTSTPPLIFAAHADAPLKSRISAESPPIDLFPGPRRPASRGKDAQETGTPKASHGNILPRFSATNSVSKLPMGSAFHRKDTRPMKGFLKMTPETPIVETPAFCPKQNSTSTAFKTSSTMGNLNSLSRINPRKIQSSLTRVASVEEEDLSSSELSTKKETDHGLKSHQLVKTPAKPPAKTPAKPPAKTPAKSPVIPPVIPSVKSPAKTLIRSPARSPVVPAADLKFNRSATKDLMPNIKVNGDAFDSPQSSCSIMFSPASANNSFFSMDAEMEFPASSAPKFNLDFDDDDISPSGRVSLCPPIVEKEILEIPEAPSRRKSLQALIHRYRDLVASSKPYEAPKMSPPLSPEPDLPEKSFSDEIIDVNLDVNMDDLNLDDINF